jgi:hypothetical protein
MESGEDRTGDHDHGVAGLGAASDGGDGAAPDTRPGEALTAATGGASGVGQAGESLSVSEAAAALLQADAGRQDMRMAVNPLWFMLSMSAAIGAVCATLALPYGWLRIVVCLAVIAGELAALMVWRVRVRGLRFKSRWTRPDIGKACVGGVIGLVGFLVSYFALDESLWAAVVGLGVWIVLSLWFLAVHKMGSRRWPASE